MFWKDSRVLSIKAESAETNRILVADLVENDRADWISGQTWNVNISKFFNGHFITNKLKKLTNKFQCIFAYDADEN